MSVRTLSDRVRSVFMPRRVRNAYRATFGTDYGRIVLAHLADTCNAITSTTDTEPIAMAAASARRDVWLVIQDMLRLSEDDLRDMLEGVAGLGGEDE